MNLKELIGTVAPTIATALGGPLAGVAVKAAAGALGLSEHTEEALQTALAGAKPDDLLKLKQADQQFAKDMRALDIDLERISAGDRDSARKRQMELKDSTPAQLAWMVIGGFIVVSAAQLVAIMGWPDVVAKIPGQGWLLIGNISGYLANEAKQAAAYYFGSSVGSKEKDATLSEIAKQP